MYMYVHVPVWRCPCEVGLTSCGSIDRWSFDILVFFSAAFPLSDRYWQEGSPACVHMVWQMGWCAREDGDMCEGKHVNHMCMYMYRRMLNGLRVQKVVSMTTSHHLYYVCMHYYISGKPTISIFRCSCTCIKARPIVSYEGSLTHMWENVLSIQ